MKIGIINNAQFNSAPLFDQFLSELEIEGGTVINIPPVAALNETAFSRIPKCDLYVVESLGTLAAANTAQSLRALAPDAKILVLHHEKRQHFIPPEDRERNLRRYFMARGADTFIPWNKPVDEIRRTFSRTLNLDEPLHLRPPLGEKNIIQSGLLHFVLSARRLYLIDPNRQVMPRDEFNDLATDSGVTPINPRAAFDISGNGQYYNQFPHLDLSPEMTRLVEVLYKYGASTLVPTQTIKLQMFDGPLYPTDENLDDLVHALQQRIGILLANEIGLAPPDKAWASSAAPLAHLHGAQALGYCLNVDVDEGFHPTTLLNDAYYAELHRQLLAELYPDDLTDEAYPVPDTDMP